MKMRRGRIEFISICDNFYIIKYRNCYVIQKHTMNSSKPISGHDFAIQKLQDTCKSVCKEFGFTAVSPYAINKLSAILRSKLNQFSQDTRVMTENTGRTQSTVFDVIAALKLRKVNLTDLYDYAKHAKSERLHALPLFPVPDIDIHKSDESFFEAMYGPKPSERELEERKPHMLPYLRALHPDWIEEENKAKAAGKVVKKVVKTAADKEQEEFNKLKRINTYRRNETPEAQKAREEKERLAAEEVKYNKKRNKERFDLGITAFADSDLPNFEDMDYHAMGFFKDYEESKRLEAERIKAQQASKLAAMLAASAPAAQLPSTSIPGPGDWQNPVLIKDWRNETGSAVSPSSNVNTDQFVATVSQAPESSVSSFTEVDPSIPSTSVEDAGPTFKMSEIVRTNKPLLKISGTGSNPGSAPNSRPGSGLGTPIKKQFGPGRPKKPKPEGVVTIPKPKGRPPKKATLEKRKRLSEQVIAQQQKRADEMKEDKTERPEKKSRKMTLAEEIRDQLLRARSQMVLPNCALPQPPQPEPVPAPVFTFMETVTDVPVVGAMVDIGGEECVMDDPAMEVEIHTADVSGGPMPNADLTQDLVPVKEKKHKKEKRDKNSEEYKEYKRQKKEKRRREREERKESEQKVEEQPVPVTEVAPVPEPVATEEQPAEAAPKPKLKLKIKFGSSFLPTPAPAEAPMRPEPTSSSSRPTSSRDNYTDNAPPPPTNPPPLKFRFKNLFNSSELQDEKKETQTTSDRPDSSLRVESPTFSKHHKKEKKDKEHKKHKKDKKEKKERDRDREKEREREERKERERQKEDAARREMEEKARLEMEARRVADEEEEKKREKEKRREERRKEKERQKEKEERRERKERERELERERERERELEREREKERERQREEQEAQRRREEAAAAAVAPRPLLSQEDNESEGSESSEEIWICPVCSVAYTVGANMVGCDQCQDWFHWHCVGLTAEPTDSSWFCNRCSKGNKSKKHGKRPAHGPHGSEGSAKRKKN
uniref:PHD-type domain-containing protein n=2 Tax=Caenorhabditis tropicalis TaxID=1561998 RepID=A0A1I7TZH7_9PELO